MGQHVPQLPVGGSALLEKGRLSPGLAWGLSLALPGAGQLYARRYKAGVLTLLFVVAGWSAAVFAQPLLAEGGQGSMLFGVALRVVVGLWAFASVDAYFTAREINAGWDPNVGPNPRAAAVLNLLTRGFGYFYAGESKRGWTAFVAVGVLNSALRQAPDGMESQLLGWLSELLMAITAVDGYRCARQKQLEKRAGLVALHASVAPSRVPPMMPVLGGVALLGSYLMVGVMDLVAPSYDVMDHAGESVTPGEEHLVWRSTAYGVRANIPMEWTLEDPAPDWALLQATDEELPCDGAIALEPTSAFITLQTAADATVKALNKATPRLVLKQTTTGTLGGMAAVVLHLEEPAGQDVPLRRMTYFIAHRGLTRHVLITNDWSTQGECDAALQAFQQGYALE